MLEAAREQERLLMINFSYRFREQSQVLRRIVDAGEVGEIYFARTGWLRSRGIPAFGGWFGQKDKSGGGPLIDLGVHRLDLALWLMGYPKPVSVSGAAYNKVACRLAAEQGKKYDVEDLAAGLIRFENGATLIVQASWAGNSEKREEMFTELFGTKGGIIQRNLGETYQFEMKLFRDMGGAYVETNLRIPPQDIETPWQHFVRCIRTDTQPMCSGEQGLAVQRILNALYRSSELGKEVRIKS
jgi:predicted dehydrogenase